MPREVIVEQRISNPACFSLVFLPRGGAPCIGAGSSIGVWRCKFGCSCCCLGHCCGIVVRLIILRAVLKPWSMWREWPAKRRLVMQLLLPYLLPQLLKINTIRYQWQTGTNFHKRLMRLYSLIDSPILFCKCPSTCGWVRAGIN